MNVLVVTSSYPRDADDHAGRFVRDLNVGLQNAGLAVKTLAPHASGLAERTPDSAAGPVARFRSTVGADHDLVYGDGMEANAARLGRLAAWRALARLGVAAIRTIRREAEGCDVILAHWLAPAGTWAVRARTGIPVVGVAHGGDVHWLSRGLLGLALRRPLVRKLSAVVATTASGCALGEMLGVAPDLIVRTPMGIDTECFRPSAKTPRAARRIVAAGRLVAIKGFDVLVRASAALDADLVIAGDGPERPALARLARELGVNLQLPGRLGPTKLSCLFQSASVVAVPSRELAGGRTEGVPVVALEAACCGSAIVGSETGGLPDVLTGPALVPPGDPVALARVLADAIEDPTRFLVPDAASRFSRDAVARKVARVLERVSRDGRSSRA